ncbi:MAG TPA: hypothetical protein ENH62_01075 [Marinobacter sp.]|uniref:Uncharacterized protein n=1 Tax=marine sediment metagenome TaxID=412755 RepID=A0A0F9JCW5_9ZZZZ|nr:hypothetical protein [Marinobacter sp.]
MGSKREHELTLGDPIETGRGVSQEISIDGRPVGVFYSKQGGRVALCDQRLFTLTTPMDPVAAEAMKTAAPEAPEPTV